MPPTTQKALYLEKRFGSYVVGDIAMPKPGPGQVLIKVLAAGLNPVDWKIKEWGMFYEKESDFPAVLGSDLAGTVEGLGDGVTDFKVGDSVFTQAPHLKGFKGYQQHAVAFASTLSKVPSNLSVDQAGTIAGSLTAPYVGLYREVPAGFGLHPPTSPGTQGIYKGTPIVVLGGATSVGQNVIQLARLSGLSPIITTASLSNSEYLKSLGATHVFDRNLPADLLKTQVHSVSSGAHIKYVYDCVSIESTQKAGLALLDEGGAIALVGPPVLGKSGEGKRVFQVIGWLRKEDNLPLLEPFYHDYVRGFFEKGFLKPNAVEVLSNGLHGVPDGLERLKNDQISRLKLVSRPQETV